MIRKLLICIVFFIPLNGCVQGLAFLGPAISYSKSGSTMQAMLSYGSNLTIKKIRTKSDTKDKKNAFDN